MNSWRRRIGCIFLLISIVEILYYFQFYPLNKDEIFRQNPVVTHYSIPEPLNPRVVNHESIGKFFMETSYLNALAQYKNFAGAPNNRHQNDTQSITFEHKTFTYFDQLHIIINVFHNGSMFPGCTLRAQEMFRQLGEDRISLCSTEDFFNGTYAIICTNPGVPCVHIHVELLFCYNTAANFMHSPTVLKDSFCFGDLVKLPPPLKKAGKTVSWSKDKAGYCKNLYIYITFCRKSSQQMKHVPVWHIMITSYTLLERLILPSFGII